MRFARYILKGIAGIAVNDVDGRLRGLPLEDHRVSVDLDGLIASGTEALMAAGHACRTGEPINADDIEFLPPLARPGKILCIGLNYEDHTAEFAAERPDHPVVFARFSSTLVGHGQAVERPRVSGALDYEGEIVAVIGKRGRHISREAALDHVAGYSLFNDVSVRDYQMRTPQWTLGKNFDRSGAFGPWLVTADELPAGCRGVGLKTRLNGVVVQDANTDDMIFDVAFLIAGISEAMTLEPGDMIVTGTPAGVGGARNPPLWMKAGDVVEVDGGPLGALRNVVVEEELAQDWQ